MNDKCAWGIQGVRVVRAFAMENEEKALKILLTAFSRRT